MLILLVIVCFSGDDDDDSENTTPSLLDYVTHYLLLPWKVIQLVIQETTYTCERKLVFASMLM